MEKYSEEMLLEVFRFLDEVQNTEGIEAWEQVHRNFRWLHNQREAKELARAWYRSLVSGGTLEQRAINARKLTEE